MTERSNSENAKARSSESVKSVQSVDSPPLPAFPVQKPLPLSDQERDILTLLNAASVEGIAPDGLLAQAGAAGVQIARDTALAALRRFARHGLATMQGHPPRIYITGAGSALCGGGL